MITAANLGFEDEGGAVLLQGVKFEVPVSQHTAVVGGGSGKDALALLVAGLLRPSTGTLSIGDRDLATLPQSVTGRRMAYVGAAAYHFPISVYENLVYGLVHRPIGEVEDTEERRRSRTESERSGNSLLERDADWIDYQAAGASDAQELLTQLFEAITQVDLADDIYGFGLRGTIDPTSRPDLAEGILRARSALRDKLTEPNLVNLVEPFDFERFNTNATLAENILFGTPVGPAFQIEALPDNPYMRSVLREAGLEERLLETGLKIAETMVELFADLPSGHPFFEQFSFIEADHLPEFQTLVTRAQNVGVDSLDPAEQKRLFQLPFRYIEARHRLDLIDPDMQKLILEARRPVRRGLPQGARRRRRFLRSRNLQ